MLPLGLLLLAVPASFAINEAAAAYRLTAEELQMRLAKTGGTPHAAIRAPAMAGPAAQGVRVTQVVESAAPMRLVYDPKSPAANAEGYVTMPNVNVVEEMADMISASRSFQTNAEMMNTAKTMMQKVLTLGQ